MIEQSVGILKWVMWFISLVFKVENFEYIELVLKKVKVVDLWIILMVQGQKQSCFVVWIFIGNGDWEKWWCECWQLLVVEEVVFGLLVFLLMQEQCLGCGKNVLWED